MSRWGWLLVVVALVSCGSSQTPPPLGGGGPWPPLTEGRTYHHSSVEVQNYSRTNSLSIYVDGWLETVVNPRGFPACIDVWWHRGSQTRLTFRFYGAPAVHRFLYLASSAGWVVVVHHPHNEEPFVTTPIFQEV